MAKSRMPAGLLKGLSNNNGVFGRIVKGVESEAAKRATPMQRGEEVSAPAAARMVRIQAPAGYRPGVDPEHQYMQPATMKKGGAVKKMAKGGMTRGDGCCMKGKTKGRVY